MNVLKFRTIGQTLFPESDLSNMVAGSENYYEAEFNCDETWNGMARVAMFITDDATEYQPLANNRCFIPTNVLKNTKIFVSLIGQSGSSRVQTNPIVIRQKKGGE